MKLLIYTIDSSRTQEDDLLVIKIQEASRIGLLMQPSSALALTLDAARKLASGRDTALLELLESEERSYAKGQKKPFSSATQTTFHISPAATSETFKLFALAGNLFFKEKQLVVDLYGTWSFHYIAKEKSAPIEGWVAREGEELSITQCDLVGRGSKHWFINGIRLKFIDTELSWKDLKAAWKGAVTKSVQELVEDAEEDTTSPRIEVKYAHEVSARMPYPVLVLADRHGGFASLFMSYGDDVREVPFHDTQKAANRNIKEETLWEKDLLDTDFVRKPLGNSHYYCPLDKVAKSLGFLLEIGWNIRDWKGNKIHLHTHVDISARMREEQVTIRGKIHYGNFTVDLDQAIGAFNRRDRFVQMGNGHVALLPTSLEQLPLQELAEECETVGNEIHIKRTQFHILDAFNQAVPQMNVDEQLQTLRNNFTDHQKIDSVALTDNFHGTLRPYQQEGLNWLKFLYTMGLNGILADDMGLGKTIQVIAFLSTLQPKGPILIVMPTSLIFNWKREFETFLPSAKCVIHQGALREQTLEALEKDHIILTTYTTLRLDLSLFSRMRYHCVILDEAQAIKNAQTQTFQAVCQLKATFRLSMTGTPIENHLMELWSHIQFLQPGLLGTQESFQAEIQAGASDMRFVQRIRKKVRPFMLRRTKDQVAKDLPEKIEQTVWVELGPEQRALYDRFLSGVKQGVLKKIAVDGLGAVRMEVLEALLRLRQICCHPLLIGPQNEDFTQSAKLESLMSDLEQSHEEGKKAIVYSQFTSMLSLISKACKERQWNFVTLDGTTKDREQVVDKFQNDPETTLFLISLKAGGAGLNLTAADHVFLFDPWWNQAVENQAIDRAHRIGQTKTIVAKRYIAVETVEEKMMTLKNAKKNLSTELIDGDPSASPLSTEDFLFLLS